MSGNICDIVPQIAVSREKNTVVIELICSDEYAATVLFEDLVSKVTSEKGVKLQLRGNLKAESGASS